MHTEHRILTMLRSPTATLAVLALALIAQGPHAADVFRLIVHGTDLTARLHSYSFAIALELAVLLFVVQGRHAESYGFAVVSIAMNLSYYYLHSVQLIDVAALPALLVSIALPVAIARYSHAVAEAQPEQALQPTVQPTSVQSASASTVASVQPQIVQAVDNDTIDKRRRAAQLRSEGLSNAQIATELDVHRNTVGKWLREEGVAA